MNVAEIQNMVFDTDHRQMFLDAHGYSIQSPVSRDSSIRRYFRVSKGEQSAILMETVPDGSPHATPGHSLGDFIRIAAWMDGVGLKVPQILEADTNQGYLLLEDLGDTSFRDALDNGQIDAKSLYGLAQDVLNHIAVSECPLELPDYYDSHVHARHRRVVDWFVPLNTGTPNANGLAEEYLSVWQDIENSLPPCPTGFVHVDFHAQNLMWLPNENGIKRCGILDFQGAMRGPLLYDLANLLEDARRDIPPEVKNECLKGLSENQRAWFRILGTQFHCRVIGQFIKMAIRDENPMYLRHVPRLQNYIANALDNPVLEPLAKFFEGQNVDFTKSVDIERAELIHSDAA